METLLEMGRGDGDLPSDVESGKDIPREELYHQSRGVVIRQRALAVCTMLALAFAPLHSARALGQDNGAATRLEDLARAKTGYVLKSKAFTKAGREAALALIAQMERKASSLSDADFLLGMMRVTALAANGHDCVDEGDRAWLPATRLPLHLIWFADGLVVARAAPQESDLLGARVTAIEGLAPDRLLAALRPLSGGTDAYRKWDLMWVVENGGLLHALGLARDANALRFRFRLRDRKSIARTIAFVPKSAAPPATDAVRYGAPAPYDGEAKAGWRAAADPLRAPLYLEEPDRHFRAVRLPALDALYIQLRANADAGGEKLVPFVHRVTAMLQARRPENLVLDLRFDIGGNIDLTRGLMREIATRTPGMVYVLVGTHTFSAGIAAAAIVRHDGGAHVTIVGEGVGDRLRWWSEIDVTCLPHSDLRLHGTHGLWDLVRGCAGEAGCYGDRFNAVVGTLAPDIAAPLTAAAWLAGRDPAMEAVAAMTKQAHRNLQ
jgi:hypothetical protein